MLRGRCFLFENLNKLIKGASIEHRVVRPVFRVLVCISTFRIA
jgi:hypothetical protein